MFIFGLIAILMCAQGYWYVRDNYGREAADKAATFFFVLVGVMCLALR